MNASKLTIFKNNKMLRYFNFHKFKQKCTMYRIISSEIMGPYLARAPRIKEAVVAEVEPIDPVHNNYHIDYPVRCMNNSDVV